MKKIFYLAAILIMSFSACKKDKSIAPPSAVPPVTPPIPSSYVPDNSFKIVAYMPSYKDPATVDASKYKMITHLFYAFLEINAAGDGTLNPLPQPTRFETVKQRAKANGLKFGISLAGLSEYYVKMASSATARTKFVTQVVSFAKSNDLDGVDLDWEYPSTTVGSADNFTLLVQELASELHKVNKFLSAAVTPAVYAGGVRDVVKAGAIAAVDFFNIMQYDGTNYDTSEPLNHASYKMSVASLDIWLGAKALPKEKAVVGMPLYGKDATGKVSIAYRDIEASGANLNLNIATVNGVAYGFNGIPLIKQKTQLAKERANGIMFWEFAHDSNTNNSLIKAANDQLGRAY
jgi:GH18 family chitinase